MATARLLVGDGFVLVGHGTAWTVLAAALTGTEPDVERWRKLRLPDVVTVTPNQM